MPCPPQCLGNAPACGGQSRVMPLQSCPAQGSMADWPPTFQAPAVGLGHVSPHSWQPLSLNGLWGSDSSTHSTASTVVCLPPSRLPPQHLPSQILPHPLPRGNNTHFPVTSPCTKGYEKGKERNMEGRYLIQEGFLKEVMPDPNLKG